MLNAKVVCENCETVLNVTTNNLYSKWFTEEHTHKKIKILYSVCPTCGEKKVLQLDDEKTLKQLQEVKRQYYQLARIRKSGGKTTKRQQRRYKELNNQLDNKMRVELKNKYMNCTVKNGEEILIIK